VLHKCRDEGAVRLDLCKQQVDLLICMTVSSRNISVSFS